MDWNMQIHVGLIAIALMTCAPSIVGAHEIFVSNEKDNTVSVVDTEKMEVVRTIRVGSRPRGLKISPDGSKLFVCASDSNAIQEFNVHTSEHSFDFSDVDDPEQLALSGDGKRLYTANEDSASVTAIDVETRKIVGRVDVGVEPEGIAVSPDGTTVVVTSETSNMVHFIDTAKLEVFDNVLVGSRPRHAEFSADGKKLWVSSEIAGTVSVIDVASRSIERTIGFEVKGITKDLITPVGIRLTKDGKRAFVALGMANRVAVVDAQTGVVEKYILVGMRVWHLEFTADDTLLVSTNGISNDVTVIDVAKLSPIKSIKVGRHPWGAAGRP
jgi:PQQ-dependent catabolism-associated beta-propeller protein